MGCSKCVIGLMPILLVSASYFSNLPFINVIPITVFSTVCVCRSCVFLMMIHLCLWWYLHMTIMYYCLVLCILVCRVYGPRYWSQLLYKSQPLFTFLPSLFSWHFKCQLNRLGIKVKTGHATLWFGYIIMVPVIPLTISLITHLNNVT